MTHFLLPVWTYTPDYKDKMKWNFYTYLTTGGTPHSEVIIIFTNRQPLFKEFKAFFRFIKIVMKKKVKNSWKKQLKKYSTLCIKLRNQREREIFKKQSFPTKNIKEIEYSVCKVRQSFQRFPLNFFCKILHYIHTYIIGHHNPSVRIIDLVSHLQSYIINYISELGCQ